MTQRKNKILNDLLELTNGNDSLMALYEEFKDYPGDTLDYESAVRCYEAIVKAKREAENPVDRATATDLEYSGFSDEDGNVLDSEPTSELLPSERFFGTAR